MRGGDRLKIKKSIPKNRSRGKTVRASSFPCTCLRVGKRRGYYLASMYRVNAPKYFDVLSTVLWENPKSVAEREQEQEDEAPFLVLSLLQKFPILTSQKHLF